jgi:hypothetical protein
MNLFFYFHGLKFNALMSLGTLAIATFSIPTTAVAEEACVRTSSGSIVCGTRVQKPSAGQSMQVVTAREFSFELKKCKRASEAIKCELNITNKEKDRVLRLYGTGAAVSRAVDLQGNQYTVSYVDFGGARNNQFVDQTLVQGVRLKAYVVFDNVPPQINQFALLDLQVLTYRGFGEGGVFPVQLRTINVVSE